MFFTAKILLVPKGLRRIRTCRRLQKLRKKKPRYKRKSPLQMFASSGLMNFADWDIIGPQPRTTHGNHHVIVITGWYSKLTRAISASKTTTMQVANVFQSVGSPYGFPTQIFADIGPWLVDKFFVTIRTYPEAKHRATTTNHPQSNRKLIGFNNAIAIT